MVTCSNIAYSAHTAKLWDTNAVFYGFKINNISEDACLNGVSMAYITFKLNTKDGSTNTDPFYFRVYDSSGDPRSTTPKASVEAGSPSTLSATASDVTKALSVTIAEDDIIGVYFNGGGEDDYVQVTLTQDSGQDSGQITHSYQGSWSSSGYQPYYSASDTSPSPGATGSRLPPPPLVLRL